MAQAMLRSSLQGEIEADVEIKAPATKFYHVFAGASVQEGEMGRVGTRVTWNYVLDGKPKVAKDRIEAVEPKKNIIKYRVIEGDLMKDFKSFLFTVQVTPKQGGHGSVVKWNMSYEKIDENVAHPESLLQLCVNMIKDIDKMLV
ncbi:MLP-like protein 28 [Raphanus sativus]|nr:MLP-like protein 28 [Raphanus sativus]